MSTEYFCNLDANFLRLDHLQRPELHKGTVDFDVTTAEEYWALHPPPRISPPFYSPEPMPSGSRPPTKMDFIFAFDVSSESITSEFLHSSCEAVKKVLFGNADAKGVQSAPSFPNGCRVAILTFDTTLHFYDISVCHKFKCFDCDSDFIQSDLTPMLVVADLDEVFVPLKRGIFVEPRERK